VEEITRPDATFPECARLTWPSVQWAWLSARLAALTVLPASLGTTQGGVILIRLVAGVEWALSASVTTSLTVYVAGFAYV
jgi:hypothetical protein